MPDILYFRNEFELTDCNSKEEHSPLYIEKEIDESGDVYEVTWRRIQLGTLIGKGAFGFVHSAKIILRQQIAPINVAVKLLDNDATPDDRNDFISEIEMMKRVGAHRHVIKLVACVTRGPVLAAVLEIASKGDLLKLLRAAREKKRRLTSDTSYNATEYTDLEISEDEDGLDQVYSSGEMWSDIVCDNPFDGFYMNEVIQVDYASQVASGMQHLETLRITHRDLAARNVLVDSEGILKISDFGLSRNGVYVNIRRSRPVPLRWLAPETIHDASYSTASDVWAYGVLLWEIVTLGSFPYSNLSNDQVIQYVSHGGRLPIPSSTSSKLSTLINLCWRQQHDCRPTFGTILSILAGETNEVLET